MGLGDLLKNISSGAKNAALERAAAGWIKNQTRAVREVRNVTVDTQSHSAAIELELVGETEPMEVRVGRYEIIDSDGTAFVRLHRVTSSKEWLEILASEHLVGRDFQIPTAARALLS